jgi:translation initiation factor 3 subunit F
MDQETLVLGDNFLPVVKVRPGVIFDILNSFSRRDEAGNRVVGTLMGVKRENGIEITECFVVPHHEKVSDAYVAINKDYHNNMVNFRKQINKRELVVGWFSTTSSNCGPYVTDNCSLIHALYANECEDPVHLVVDTVLGPDTDHVNIKAYMSKPLEVGSFALANVFQSLRVHIDMSNPAEVQCLHNMISQQNDQWAETTTTATIAEMQGSYATATASLSDAIAKAVAHVEKVGANVDPSVNLAISDAFAALHSVKKEDFDAIYQDKADGLLMISYITSLTKTQLVVAEKLNAVL